MGKPTTLGELAYIWDDGKTRLKIKVIKKLGA